MIGTIIGLGLAFAQISTAWNAGNDGDLFDESLLFGLGIIAAWTLIGIFIFPRTVGFAFTPVLFTTPIAFIIGWARQDFLHGFKLLFLGFSCWIATIIIAKIRPEAT